MSGRETLRAITIRQPWAWAVAYGGKDIENRTWHPSYRGPLAIHAGKAWSVEGARDRNVIDAVQRAKALCEDPEPLQHVRLPGNADDDTVLEVLRSDPRFVFGAVIAVVHFGKLHGSQACVRTNSLLSKIHPDGPYECSPWALPRSLHWEFTQPQPLAVPVRCGGQQRDWSLPADVDALVRVQLEAA